MAHTPITQLPVELIELVVEKLSIEDLRNVRFTCRDLNEKSQRCWLALHFNVSTFMLTQESLETLVDFSKKPLISPCIKDIQICLVTFTKHTKSRIRGLPISPEEHREFEALNAEEKEQTTSGSVESLMTSVEEQEHATKLMEEWYENKLKRERRRIYGRQMSSQFTMRKKSIDVELLAEALRNLPAIESISVVDRIAKSSPPWGLRKLNAETGVEQATGYTSYGRYRIGYNEDPLWGVHISMRQHTIGVVLGAIIRSGVKLKRLSFQGTPYNLRFPKDLNSRRVYAAGTPATTFCESQMPELGLALENLQSLSLSAYNYTREQTTLPGHDKPLDWLMKYKSALQNLKRFSFKGATIHHPPLERYFIHCLSASGLFPHLRQLTLQSTDFSGDDLAKFIRSHQLEELRTSDCYSKSTTQAREIYGYGKVIEALKDSPSMRVLDLNMANTPQIWSAGRLAPVILEGLDVSQVLIVETDPGYFQLRLENLNVGYRLN